MVRIISALILAVTAACVSAQEPVKLVANPPDRHIVVPGDTLWGISGKFLQEPWRWPEVWRMNRDEIKNPHRIYPGDIIVLDTSSGSPRLKIAKPLKLSPQVHSEDNPQAIPSIPANAIEPFLSKPLVIEADGLESAPRIAASQEDRVFLGNGDTGFVSGIPDAQVIDWQVYRPGKPMKDPETKDVIGYEAYYLGNAKLVQPGSPAVIRIVTAKEEIARGDRLVPALPPNLTTYLPHKPEVTVDGRIIAIYGGVNEAGKLSIISINRGNRDGLELGHVLALFRKRASEGYNDNNRRISTELPEERYAVAFVFRTFERISYALIMESSKPIIVNDAVRNP